MSKIADNISIAKLSVRINALYGLGKVVKFFGYFGVRSPKLRENINKLSKLKEEVDTLRQLPDDFNSIFLNDGWIIYESMNQEIAKQAIKLSLDDKFKEAEQLLANNFLERDIENLITSLTVIKKFGYRENLAIQAQKFYFSGHYQACALILLTLIDGFTSDLSSNNRGFFAEDTDMYAYDSIAGHETGLRALSKVLCMQRTKTNSEVITVPYRNGILHGKDLNYDNQLIAVKLWNTLFAIRDWYIAKNKKIEADEKKSFIQTIKNYSQWNQLKIKIDDWQAREIICSITFSDLDHFENCSLIYPERTAVMLFKNWKSKNYKDVGVALTNFVNYNESKMAGRARSIFGNTKLIEFNITRISDQNIMSCVIYAQCTYEKQGSHITKDLKLEMLYLKGSDPTFRVDDKGKWTIMERSFGNL